MMSNISRTDMMNLYNCERRQALLAMTINSFHTNFSLDRKKINGSFDSQFNCKMHIKTINLKDFHETQICYYFYNDFAF